ncbi:MAG TPA: adenylate/guanylate cyclase domain-containing protein [Candidatus Limnocylindrales bacterium]|nr:adenylate/guanylate cyclase domain-containing protein [Candidatus Limnocylindrales bacterium]
MRCRACGAIAGSAARFCDQCGSRLAASSEPRAPAAGQPGARHRAGATRPATADRPRRADGHSAAAGEAGDRRIVTALFADLVDYVRLVAEHDAEEVRQRVNAALGAMVDAIEAYDGTREKFIGDAVFAVFGWPAAHDDDALRATHCALAIREGLAHLQDPAGEALQVRIGLATGEVVAAPRGVAGALDWALTGPAVTTAARIQALAQPGEILLDEATRRASRKELAVEDLGEQVLRGQTRPVRLSRLLGEAGFQPWRPLGGRVVGRGSERQLLRQVLADLCEGRGATVLVEGEAGIGKSRLLADLEPHARRAGVAWTWIDNMSYGAVEPYRFARSMAQAVAEEHGTDSGSFVRQLLFTPEVSADDARRWAGGVAAIAREAAFSGWEAEAELVPPDPAEIDRDLRSVAVRYIERLIDLDGPRVLVVDDLQWLDRSSAGIFDELVRLTSTMPLALLVGSRPGSRPAALDGDDVRRLVLEGLDVTQTGELAGAVAGVAVDPDDVLRLHARTGGNPLFIGETVRAIVDEGAIGGDGRLAFARPGHATVPVTLRALLGSRIDALSAESRSVLRVASVIGMSFRESVVEEVLEERVDPDRYERLAEAAMIVPGDASGGWRFCHPLIHDAAYSSLLASDRRALHARVADRIETRSPAASLGLIARHRAAAGDRPRAVPLLVRAAESALALGARTEAAGYLEMAAELELPGLARDELLRRTAGIREPDVVVPAVPAGAPRRGGSKPG